MASCVKNIYTKNYENLIIFVQVRMENVRDVFLRHSVECRPMSKPRPILFACCCTLPNNVKW